MSFIKISLTVLRVSVIDGVTIGSKLVFCWNNTITLSFW